jgi:hypothetical protein
MSKMVFNPLRIVADMWRHCYLCGQPLSGFMLSPTRDIIRTNERT